MTHEEQRIWLIRELQKEETELSHYSIPKDEQGQKDLLRGLMNIWVPKPLSEEFLRIQDEYLTEENKLKGIKNLADLAPLAIDNRLYLWQGDMTTLKVDGVVNPANSQLLGCWRILHNCLDNLLHSGAGLALRQRCFEIMQAQGHEEPTGKAKITPAYNLPCDYVIHTVGPIVQGRLTEEHSRLLESSYKSCLDIAVQNNVQSVAFCCISTGVFGFPQDKAAQIAVRTVREFRKSHDIQVIFNVFKEDDHEIYKRLLGGN